MFLDDIVGPMSVKEAQDKVTKSQKPGHKPGWALDPKTKKELQRRQAVQQRRGVDEDSWSAGDNAWTSEHDQWTKESQDPVIALTGVDETISVAGLKTYQEVTPYKNYKIFVSKQPYNQTGKFIAYSEIGRTEFKAFGSSQQEAVDAIHEKIDTALNATKVEDSATLDFNVKFATDILGDPRQPFYAKVINVGGEPKLVIAGKEMLDFGKELAQLGFKPSSLRVNPESDRAHPLPGISYSKNQIAGTGLIANGRYELGNAHQDRDGNTVYDLVYHSTAHTKSDKLRLGKPAFTVGTKRTDEDGNGFMGADSTSPVGGNIAEDRLAVGDPVIVTAPNAYEGKTGEIAEFSPSGRFVIVRLYNGGEHSMHLSDVEYNQYADDEDADEYGEYEDEQGVAEAGPNAPYTPSPAKPFRNPKGFNKQGTGVGNKLADLNRKEWEEKKKKEQGVAETFTPNRGQPTTKDELYQYHIQQAKATKGRAKELHLQHAAKYKSKDSDIPGIDIDPTKDSTYVGEQGVAESYWTKLQNERNTRLNSLVNELSESVKKIK